MIHIGAHLSIAKGFAWAAKTACAMGGDTFQFFSRNPRGSSVKVFDSRDLEEFEAVRKKEHMTLLLAHSPYTMNLAGTQERVYEFACQVLREDIERMNSIGIPYLNLHPGSHVGAGAKEGIRRIVEGINQAVTGKETLMVLLETMSGKGSEVGWRFEELREIIDGCKYPERMGVCMDLCHVYSAGYDIVGDLDKVLNEFDRCIGLNLLKAVHLNDSMTDFGSRKDRHAPIGKGTIGFEAILRILRHPALENLPFYLETPLDDEGHGKEIAMIKEMLE